MRDYLLAQHLLGVFAADPSEFERLLAAQQSTQAQSIEGLQRFLFYASRMPVSSRFYDRFRRHTWYAAVYDREVFAIPPSHLNDEDRLEVESALASGGERAVRFARELSPRWESGEYPVLNLSMLLDVFRVQPPSFFEDIVVPAFARTTYGGDSLATQFYRFVDKEVIPSLGPSTAQTFAPLLRLILVLLPLDASPTLDSSAMQVFGRLSRANPGIAVDLLTQALGEGTRSHRAFLWRLLSEVAGAIQSPAPLAAAAKADIVDDESSVSTRREAARFLDCLSAARTVS
jgi:hypothetical protein